MKTATHDDVLNLFPDMQDHAVLEILAARATVDELEAAGLLLQDIDEGLIDMKRAEGDRLNQLLRILIESGLRNETER